jgi:hypothetical protein
MGVAETYLTNSFARNNVSDTARRISNISRSPWNKVDMTMKNGLASRFPIVVLSQITFLTSKKWNIPLLPRRDLSFLLGFSSW